MTLLVDCLKAAWEAKGMMLELKSTTNEIKQRQKKGKYLKFDQKTKFHSLFDNMHQHS